jgi:glycosyltransferase involved in cell wall biosynthesis
VIRPPEPSGPRDAGGPGPGALRVVFFLGYPTRQRGGTEHAALAWSAGLARRGHDVVAVFRHRGELLAEYGRFCRGVFVLDSPAGLLRFLAGAMRPGRMRGSVVYGHNPGRVLELWAVARLLRSACVCHLHMSSPDRLGGFGRLALRRPDLYLAVSRATAAEWARHGIPPSRIEVVPNGVDTARFTPAPDPAAAKAAYGVPPDHLVISFLGRLDRNKGPDRVIQAFAAFRAASPARPACLLVGGAPVQDGAPYLADLRRLASETGAGGDIRFVGHVADTRAFYHASDLFVLPSVWPDPQPLTLTESMACGVPALASRIGGIPEILGGAFPDHLVAPGDVGELAAGLGRLAGWRTQDPGLGARCRQVAESTFSLEVCVSRIEAALQRVRAGRAA